MNEHWQRLAWFESTDLIKENYHAMHHREANTTKAFAIAANFVQAREYFLNSERADMSVKPLLLYYGVLGMARGVILFCSPSKGPEALKQGHGLSGVDWSGTLAKGLDSVDQITVEVTNGTMLELSGATKNEAHFKANCSAFNYSVTYPELSAHAKFSLGDVFRALADLHDDYSAWKRQPFPSLLVNEITILEEGCRVRFGDGNPERIAALFGACYKPITLDGASALFPKDQGFHFSQHGGALSFAGIGSLHMIPPLGSTVYLNPISLMFVGTYFLGMLARYFPPSWLALMRQGKGDRIFPVIRAFLSSVESQFPEIVLRHLGAARVAD